MRRDSEHVVAGSVTPKLPQIGLNLGASIRTTRRQHAERIDLRPRVHATRGEADKNQG